MTENLEGPALDPGTRLAGRYRVSAPISAGAMGAVHKGVDEEDGAAVAVKQLLDVRHATSFEIEARLLTHLRHDRVVRVRDHFREGRVSYVVMDLVEGIDLSRLSQRRKDSRVPVSEAVEYARQTCEALEYIHDQQVVHRDVKPANLVCGENGIVLVDFGVARELDEPGKGTVAVGTPRFMAPEVLSRGSVSPRSDVFGVAATLWTLLAGVPPVYGETAGLSKLVEGVDSQLEQALAGGLEPTPDRRISSAAGFASALGGELSHGGAPLALSSPDAGRRGDLLESLVRAAAGVFEAAAASIALVAPFTGELVYEAAWGAGAREILGVRLKRGKGIAGWVATSGEGVAVPSCRDDSRFAIQVAEMTGYVPNTLLAVPLRRGGEVTGVLSILDRRDGEGYRVTDLPPAALFADLAVDALAHVASPPRPEPISSASVEHPAEDAPTQPGQRLS